MATKSSPKPTKRTRARPSKPRAKAAPKAAAFTMPKQPDFGDLAKMAKAMTPEQAFDLYKTNSKLALEVINAAIENTSKAKWKRAPCRRRHCATPPRRATRVR